MSRSQSAKGPSQRQLRVGELLRHALIDTLGRGDVHDPVLASVPVTISEVRVSPDLRQATAFVLPLGGDGADRVIAALNANARYLRGQTSRRVRQLKYAPEFKFIIDQSFDNSSALDDLLRSPHVAQDLAEEASDEEQN